MKRAITFLAASAALLTAGAARAGDVSINLTDVQARGGRLLVALQTNDQFMRPAGFGEIVDNPQTGTVTVTFRDVPAGDYAVSALHDLNGDGQMQTSDIGIPVEGWAMSNGAALRGPPTFDQVRVSVPSGGTQITEPMFYWDGQIPGQ